MKNLYLPDMQFFWKKFALIFFMEINDFKNVSAFGQNIYYIYLYYEIDLLSYLRTFGCATFFLEKNKKINNFTRKIYTRISCLLLVSF